MRTILVRLALGVSVIMFVATPAFANMTPPPPKPTYHTKPQGPCEIARYYEAEALLEQAIFKGTISTNQNVLAFYATGPHAIVGEDSTHYGIDLVLAGCQPGQVYQWFYGKGDHSSKETDETDFKVAYNNSCPADWVSLPNAQSQWGNYLTPGVLYCAKTLEGKMPF